MFSLFTRNYVMTFLGMLFFGIMFFSNLDMVFQDTTILTENWIPNFVGWLVPMMLFLYFWMFFVFQNRLLFGCKKAKKSLKLLFLLVSILYSLISIIIFIYIVAWYTWLIPFLIIALLLAFKNFYYHVKVKHKQYFGKLKKKIFVKNISIFGITLVTLLLIFNRSIWDISIPKNYFKIDIKSFSITSEKIEIFSEINPEKYLALVANKSDKNADYNVITYNLDEKSVSELYRIYNLTKDFPVLWDNTSYSFKQVHNLNKINLLKIEYHMLHEEYDTAVWNINNFIKNNQKILKYALNMNDFNIFLENQTTIIDLINKNKQAFSEAQLSLIFKNLDTLNIKNIWKETLEKQFNYNLSNIWKLYNIPLIINKEESFQLAIYIEYLKSENLINSIDDLSYSSIFRKNYIWLSIIEDSQKEFTQEYKKLSELSIKIQDLKNTLN